MSYEKYASQNSSILGSYSAQSVGDHFAFLKRVKVADIGSITSLGRYSSKVSNRQYHKIFSHRFFSGTSDILYSIIASTVLTVLYTVQ